MRIVAGKFGGRLLHAPAGRETRPTTDKVRQAVFNMLCARGLVEDAIVLDAFCGTGALGLEALSQGALFCTFFDMSQSALAACRVNVNTLNLNNSVNILKRSALNPGNRPDNISPATLVFLDPPYGKSLAGQACDALKDAQWLAPDAWIVVESAKTDHIDFGTVDVQKTYGDTKITLLQ